MTDTKIYLSPVKVGFLVLAVLLTVLLAASPALAYGAQYQYRWGGGSGTGSGGSTALSQTEKDWLRHMRQEEKLARDVYLKLYDRWRASIFSGIATSEQRHMDAVENLILKYGLPDPVTDEANRGNFADAAFNDLYASLVNRGLTSLQEAYQVGVDIEVLDINDLKTAIAGTTHADISNVYNNLLSGSYNHLSAFQARQ